MRAALRFPDPLSVSEWAGQNIVLDESSAEPGPLRPERTPYTREWQDSASEPHVRQITTVASTQVGKSQSGLNVLAWAVCEDPGPITWVMPTREDANEFGENRVQPMIDNCAALSKNLSGDRFDAKKRQIQFSRCRILFRSAVTPKELAQYPARWLFGDECDKWPQRAKGEAPPFDLARERTRTFWNHKIYLTSTPTTEAGLIWREFKRGDQRRYHVPCPHCGAHQVLRWGQVKWPEDVRSEEAMRDRKEAWYECEACSERIDDRQKQLMLEKGVWCPKAYENEIDELLVDGVLELPDDTTAHRSYHIWAGYSPWLGWWEIAAEFLRTHGTPEFQNFVNSWLGEPWVERVDDSRPEELRACVGGYHRGDVPEGIKVVTAGVDVQKRFLVFTLRGWGLDMESWLLDHGRVDDFDQLAGVLFSKVWPRDVRLHSVFIDANYRTSEVIDFARAYPAFVKMCRGQEFEDPIPFRAQSVERHPRTGAAIGLKAWHVNVGMFKDLVAQSVRIGGVAEPGGFHVYDEVDEAYLEEMTSEHKIMQRKGARERERWVKKAGHVQNHYWDTEVYNRALAHLIRVDLLRREEDGGGRKRRPQRSRDDNSNRQQGGRLWRRT
jgi:phage terminase large subunit GpA-like protein